MQMNSSFDYYDAFSRNLGFVSKSEQSKLRDTTIAIAGAGGAGSGISMALARLGFGRFHIADLDVYEVPNFNRQLGATMSTINREKVDVIENMILDINPEAMVRKFEQGISPGNIDQFLDGVDVVIDALDFYCFSERMLLFPTARKKGMWVFTAPPLGFGCAVVGFDPKGLAFEDYFGFEENMPQDVWIERFMAGLSPNQYLMQYLEKEHIDFEGGKLPSVGIGVFFLAGFVATEVVKLMVGRHKPLSAPDVLECDAMLGQFKVTTKAM